MKLHRLAKDDTTYLLLALTIGTDQYGHLEGFNTDPYGDLEYGLGSDDDFLCGAFAIRRLDDALDDAICWTKAPEEIANKVVVVTHITRNSETASFIEDAVYRADIVDVGCLNRIRNFVSEIEGVWFGNEFPEVSHDRRGWNQDVEYFARSLFAELLRFNIDGKDYTEEQRKRYREKLYKGCLRFKPKTTKWFRKLYEGKD